jgi:Na+-driven multidrug efflux pump
MGCASAPRAGSIAWRAPPSRERRSRGRFRAVADHRGLGRVDDASRRPTRRAFEVQSSAAVGPSARRCARDASGASHGFARSRDRDRSRRGARCVPRASSSDDRDPGEPSTSASSVSEAAERSSNEEKSLDARIWALALPAVASLLLDPVLGAVDTAFVGRLEGEGAAAALGGLAVATTVFNFSFKLFNFLAVVTGPLVASQIAAAAAKNASRASDAPGDDSGGDGRVDGRVGRAAAAETVRGAMTLAVALGVSATLALEIGADGVLAWAGGNALEGTTAASSASIEPTMMSEAEAYLRVRALSAPAALVGTVAVGAFRGLLDTKTPLLVSGGANFVNLVLDPILIFGLGPVPAFGVAGAAAATTAAEWIAAAAFWALLVEEGLLPRLFASSDAGGKSGDEVLKRNREASKAPSDVDSEVDGASTATSPPSGVRGWAKALKPLAAGSASQLARTLLLQAVLVRATAEAAGAGAAGAHQICIQVWWVTLFALDALAVAAQSLVAASLGAGDVPGARRAAERSLSWGLAAGTAVGVGLLVAGPMVPRLFTDDADLARAALPSLTSVALLQPLNAAVFVGDGVLQGAADFDYLAMAMAASAAPALLLLSRVGAGVETDIAAGVDAEVVSATALTGVWQSMSALQLGRAGTLSWRYFVDGKSPVAVGERASLDTDEAGKENGE